MQSNANINPIANIPVTTSMQPNFTEPVRSRSPTGIDDEGTIDEDFIIEKNIRKVIEKLEILASRVI